MHSMYAYYCWSQSLLAYLFSRLSYILHLMIKIVVFMGLLL